MANGSAGNGWEQWSKHVLHELNRLNTVLDKLSDRIGKLQAEVIALKVKAGVWGAIGAAIPVIVGLIILLIKHRL